MEPTQKTYIKTNVVQQKIFIPVIIGATVFSMAFMFLFIALEVPMVLTIALFMGLIFLSIYSFMYSGEYWIDGEQLEEKLTPKLSFMPFLKPKHNFYKWAELDTYIEDTNMNRYSGEQRYLKLTYKNPKRVVIINEGNNSSTKEQYAFFIHAFNALLADEPVAETTIATEPLLQTTANTTENIAPTAKPINARQQKSFYQSWAGKALAIFFTLLSAVFLGMYFFPQAFGGLELKGTNSWKLWAIVIPGTIYMLNKAFFSNKK